MHAPRLSVVVCTYNPREDLFARTLSAIARQTMNKSEYELLIIDNNSSPALDLAHVAKLAGRETRLIREPRQGLTIARARAIRESRAQTICFIDDDNEVDRDFLDHAANIADREPGLGVWGGVCAPALERPAGPLLRPWLPHLGVRDLGPKPQTGLCREWREFEPIGAGLCIRREVGEIYARYIEEAEGTRLLGRSGDALMSGEDSLMSRIAALLGLECGYRPQLRLTHHITAGRLTLKYIARLLEGHGRSFIVLNRICRTDGAEAPPQLNRKSIARRLLHRLRAEGPVAAFGMMFWDIGYHRQLRDINDGIEIARIVDFLPRPDPARAFENRPFKHDANEPGSATAAGG